MDNGASKIEHDLVPVDFSVEANKLEHNKENTEKVHGRPLNTSFVTGKFVGVPRSVLDISKARAALGWTPATEWQSGIEQTYEWVAQTSSTQS